MPQDFHFDLSAKRTRLSDSDLLAALQSAVEASDDSYFSTTKYDSLPGDHPHSSTIIERFGSWKKALALIGITGVLERRCSPEALVANLEKIWKEIGYPPGKRQIAALGEKYSESPYRRRWGSVRAACEAIEAFHAGRISRDQLLAGCVSGAVRTTIPLKDRWAVLKRDMYRCTKCGASPSNDHNIILEVDHIIPIARSGGNELRNLQTLCRHCNQGKKDR